MHPHENIQLVYLPVILGSRTSSNFSTSAFKPSPSKSWVHRWKEVDQARLVFFADGIVHGIVVYIWKWRKKHLVQDFSRNIHLICHVLLIWNFPWLSLGFRLYIYIHLVFESQVLAMGKDSAKPISYSQLWLPCSRSDEKPFLAKTWVPPSTGKISVTSG